jgi:hypothetical protein
MPRLTEDDVRRIVQEELAKNGQLMPLPVLPVPVFDPNYRGMACACGPGQCAMLQTGGVPCTHYRQSWS